VQSVPDVTSDNFIKCRFCAWTTRKWGHGSNTSKAFARLANHIGQSHPDEDDNLMAFRLESATEMELSAEME